MLRGKLLVKINKATKVKGITLAFKGRSRTEWPEGEDFDPGDYQERS